MKMKYFLERYFQMMAYVYAYAILINLSPEKMELIIEWLIEVFSKRFPKEVRNKIIERLKEGKDMTYAIEKLFESTEEKARLDGIEKEIKY